MKIITKIFVICAVALAFGLVMGCEQPSSGSKDSGNSLNASEQKLVGTWKVTNPTSDASYFSLSNVGDWYPSEAVLASDRGAVAQIRANDGGSAWENYPNEKGTWSASASSLTINPVNAYASTITMNYTLSSDGKTFTTTPRPGWPQMTYTKQ